MSKIKVSIDDKILTIHKRKIYLVKMKKADVYFTIDSKCENYKKG